MSYHPHRWSSHAFPRLDVSNHELDAINVGITGTLQFSSCLFDLVHGRADGNECAAAFQGIVHLVHDCPRVAKVDYGNIGIPDVHPLVRVVLVEGDVLRHASLLQVALGNLHELGVDVKTVDMAIRFYDARHKCGKSSAPCAYFEHLRSVLEPGAGSDITQVFWIDNLRLAFGLHDKVMDRRL